MSLKMRYFDEGPDIWVEVDFSDARVSDLTLQFGYSHPARLSWTMHQAQHVTPIPHRAFLQFTDDDYLAGDWNSPLFEGHVHEISPGASANEVLYVAYDPTRRAAQEVTIMNGDHDAPSAYPRAVFNVKIDNDDDRAFEIEHDATTQTILETLFNNAAGQLASMRAAPESAPPYVADDLVSLDYKSQEKIVFESETIRGGIDRLLGPYPQFRILFHPGVGTHLRVWRFVPVMAAPAVTLALNDFSPANPHPVLAMKLSRSLEGRYTAVKIYGPERTAAGDVQVNAGGLVKLWNPAFESGFGVAGPAGSPDYQNLSRVWQIDDPERRHMANILPTAVQVDHYSTDGGKTSVTVFLRTPTLLATWDDGDTWEPISNCTIDRNQGIITAPYHVYKYDPEAPLPYVLPDNVRLVHAYFQAPLSVRYPATGHGGTAFTVAGAQIEMRHYDESLAVGFERYVIADQEERLEQFGKLAQSIQEARRDIVHTGGCTLRGLRYDFARLNTRIHFAAVDAQGEPLTTGWENIGAILTDVEFDFAQQLTTLQFSSDHAEFLQEDPEELKRLLKLDARRAEIRRPAIITYRDGRTGRIIAQYSAYSLNEDIYGGDDASQAVASRYDPNSPNYQGGN